MDGYKIDKLMQEAVERAVEAGMSELERRIQIAIDTGAAIGAEAGARAAAAAASKAAARERTKLKKQQSDRRYHDAKLLVRKYRQLNEYYRNAIFDEAGASEEDEDFEEIMRSFGAGHRDQQLTAESIRRNYLVTRIIMAHVTKMLEVYETMCQNSRRAESKRRWQVLHDLYLADEPTTAEELAEKLGIEKRTVYRDIDACVSDLAVLFFGISAIDD